MTNTQRVELWHAEWLQSDGPHWGDKIVWGTAEEIAHRLDAVQVAAQVAAAPAPVNCDLAPAGWYCTRAKDHAGPCAAYPDD